MTPLALALAAVVLGGVQDAVLESLAAEARWEELIAVTAEHLAGDHADTEALYWSGRAHVERAQDLLAARASRRTRRGVDLALDLAHALLDRGREQLARVPDMEDGPWSDADEWIAYGRYLRGDDPGLAGDLEHWYESEHAGYAAYVRALIARDAGDAKAAEEWFGRAASADDTRPEFALAWAESLAARGERAGALEAWESARVAGAERDALLATLQAVLPGEVDAADRLERLDSVLAEEHAGRDALLAWYRAFALEQLGRVVEAEAGMARATENRSDATERARARLLALVDRPREARGVLAEAVARGDDEALEQVVALADELGLARRFDEALAAYDDALAAEPHHERARANRALTLARSGRSLDGYAELLARHPGRTDLLNDAGLAAWGWGRVDVARDRLEAAAGLPGAVDALENLAALLLSEQPVDSLRARALLDTVLLAEPGRPRALFLRHRAAAITSR